MNQLVTDSDILGAVIIVGGAFLLACGVLMHLIRDWWAERRDRKGDDQ